MDVAQLKGMQKKGWTSFVPFEVFTGTCAPRLVTFSSVRPDQTVLDVACGTGVVALAAARAGARATGIDLTPELVARAKENAEIAGLEIDVREGDAEELAFPDASFDVVVSQFGHMFAPRPDVAIKEMLRVLKPGGTIAFSTFPPELFAGQLLDLPPKHLPTPPLPSPSLWGKPDVVRERLGAAVRDVVFDRDAIVIPALSVPHLRAFFERNIAPFAMAVNMLSNTPEKLAAFRRDFDALLATYFDARVSSLRQDYLLTRAKKA